MHRLAKLNQHLLQNENASTHNAQTSNTRNAQTPNRTILLGPIPKQFGTGYGLLPNLNAMHSKSAIREQFWADGYGLFRNVIDRDTVLKARKTILTKVLNKHKLFTQTENAIILKPDVTPEDIPCLEGMNDVTHHNDVLNAIENKGIQNVMKTLLDCDRVKTFDYKWLRLVSPGLNTGVHVDNVYMNRGTPRLLTCWIPLMDITMELGTVFILDGSYHLPAFNVFQRTYGSMDAEKINLNGTGHFTQDPDEMEQFFKNEEDYKIRWKSCDFKAGDVLIFTMRTVHMSSVNMSKHNQVRMSCDTRWLNANEVPDARYMRNGINPMGIPDKKFGLYNTDDHDDTDESSDQVTIKQLRQKWGI